MGAAYSQDLRQRVLSALDGGMSKMEAHRVFRISRSTLDDWLRLRAQTGSVLPVVYRRGKAPSVPPAALRQLVEEQPDRTLAEMALVWHERGGAKLSVQTFSTALRRLGYTRKKRASSSSSGASPNVKDGSRRSSAGSPRSGSTSTRPEHRTP